MTDAAEWRGRVGEAWAQEWRRTDRTIGPVNDILVAEVADQLGEIASPRILDVGCGAGATSLALKDRIPAAEIVGVDLSADLVSVASERAAFKPDVRFEAGDAATFKPGGERFDAIVSRHGVMFFDDPVAAFSNFRALAAPGARLVFTCFRGRAENEWAMAIAPILEQFAPAVLAGPPPAVGPFAFADTDKVAAILTAAGFAAPRFEPFDFDFVTGVGDDPVADAISFFRHIGPFAALIRELDEARAAAAVDRLTGIASQHRVGDTVRFRAAVWLVSSQVA